MTRFFAERQRYGDAVALYAIQGGDQRGDLRQRAKPVEWEDHQPGEFQSTPMLSISPESAQRLMDELWTIGLRPTKMIEGEGERGAMQAHINDLRLLAFRALDITKRLDGNPLDFKLPKPLP